MPSSKAKICKWTRKTPDGTPGLRGPLEELRKGAVQTRESGGLVTWFVGTPVFCYGQWVAYVIVDPQSAAGGSWLPSNWRLITGVAPALAANDKHSRFEIAKEN